jgi:hypothetical protein
LTSEISLLAANSAFAYGVAFEALLEAIANGETGIDRRS